MQSGMWQVKETVSYSCIITILRRLYIEAGAEADVEEDTAPQRRPPCTWAGELRCGKGCIAKGIDQRYHTWSWGDHGDRM
jgi:hypothetical protein